MSGFFYFIPVSKIVYSTQGKHLVIIFEEGDISYGYCEND